MPQLSHESAEIVVPSFSHWRAESGATFPTAVEQARLQRLRRSLAPLAHLFRDRDVLDFGASSALSTCVIHELGAKSVCGTEPAAGPLLELTACAVGAGEPHAATVWAGGFVVHRSMCLPLDVSVPADAPPRRVELPFFAPRD